MNVLMKIPARKIMREKGKSICVILAVFFTTVLFVMVFSTLLFLLDAGEEMVRASSPMLMDAALSVTKEEYGRIGQNKRVSDIGMGIRLGIMREPSGAGGIQLYHFEEKMARWMRYYPTEGRMPQNGREVALSDQYLRERGITYRENNILFLIAAIPALIFGYTFSAAILPGILSGFTMIQVKQSGNLMIFVLSLFFSWGTVKISERKPVKLAKNSSPMEMKKYMGKLRRVKQADNRDCLKKFVVRHFNRDKKKVLKVCISIGFSIFIANAFYTIEAGFDEEEYVKDDLDADFILAKKSILTSPGVNTVSYPRTLEEEIAKFKNLPGIKEAGGGTVSLVCLLPSGEVWDDFVEIAGEDSYSTPGEMYTTAYGLSDMMLKKLKPVKGEIDMELFRTGEYVLLDPIMSDDNPENRACYEPGDEVTIPFRSGEKGTYKVMAVVEELPYSLDFPGRYPASSLYLPMKEWQEKEKRKDYYLYAFDVEEKYRDTWDEALEAGTKDSLLSYKSVKTMTEKAKSYVKGLKMAGVVLSMILLSMGILNFINCTVEGIYIRRKEFAIFQSLGMEEQEIKKSLAKEGMLYILGGFATGVLITIPGVYILLEKVLMEPYIKYHMYPYVYFLFALLGSGAAVLVPWIFYKRMDSKENFLERIRSCRE